MIIMRRSEIDGKTKRKYNRTITADKGESQPTYRAKCTLKQIEDLFDSVNGDYLTIEDMKTVLSEELGIEFKEV